MAGRGLASTGKASQRWPPGMVQTEGGVWRNGGGGTERKLQEAPPWAWGCFGGMRGGGLAGGTQFCHADPGCGGFWWRSHVLLQVGGGTDSDLVCAGSVADEDSFLGNTADLETGLQGMPAAVPRPSLRVPAPHRCRYPCSATWAPAHGVLFVLVTWAADVRCLSQSRTCPPPTSPSAVKGPCSTRLLTRKRKVGLPT